LLLQAKGGHQKAVKERDALRGELHALGQAFSQKHSALEEQVRDSVPDGQLIVSD
jgi:hypothetical protein